MQNHSRLKREMILLKIKLVIKSAYRERTKQMKNENLLKKCLKFPVVVVVVVFKSQNSLSTSLISSQKEKKL